MKEYGLLEPEQNLYDFIEFLDARKEIVLFEDSAEGENIRRYDGPVYGLYSAFGESILRKYDITYMRTAFHKVVLKIKLGRWETI